jgi:hypothetical protein
MDGRPAGSRRHGAAARSAAVVEAAGDQTGPAEVTLLTRYEQAALADPIARELIIEVRCHADDPEEAVSQAASLAANLVPLLSLAVNAHVPIPEPYLAYEIEPALERRRFWQAYAPLEQGLPRPSRILRKELLFPLLQATLSDIPERRVLRTVGQYPSALHHWSASGRSLALAHLYMALEALAPVAERAARERLGLDNARQHAIHRDVDVSRSNWHDVLLGFVRRDELCQGDKTSYDLARRASNGFEHGFMDLPEVHPPPTAPPRCCCALSERGSWRCWTYRTTFVGSWRPSQRLT